MPFIDSNNQCLLGEDWTSDNAHHLEGTSPIHLAVQAGKIDLIEILLKKGFNPQSRRQDGKTPLHLAAIRGSQLLTAVLLAAGAGPNLQDKNGQTPIHLSSYYGHERIFEMLVRNGGDTNPIDQQGNTPLHLAALQGYAKVVEVILDSGGDPNILNFTGKTPGQLAKDNGHVDVAALLTAVSIQGGFNCGNCIFTGGSMNLIRFGLGIPRSLLPLLRPNQLVDLITVTATRQFDWATTRIWDGLGIGYDLGEDEREKEEEIEFTPLPLLLEGKEVGDGVGESEKMRMELERAVKCGNVTRVRELLALSDQSDRAASTMQMIALLHKAASDGNNKMMRILLDNGVSASSTNIHGQTPLHHAVREGHQLVAVTLLQVGGDPNHSDIKGRTSLHVAAEMGRYGLVEMLVRQGAKVGVTDREGNLPIHLAALNGHSTTCEVLLDNGSPQISTKNTIALYPRALRSTNRSSRMVLNSTDPTNSPLHRPRFTQSCAKSVRSLPIVIHVLLKSLMPQSLPLWLATTNTSFPFYLIAYGSPHTPNQGAALCWTTIVAIGSLISGACFSITISVWIVIGLLSLGAVTTLGLVLILWALLCFGPLPLLLFIVGRPCHITLYE